MLFKYTPQVEICSIFCISFIVCIVCQFMKNKISPCFVFRKLLCKCFQHLTNFMENEKIIVVLNTKLK